MDYKSAVQNYNYGKKLPDAIYMHKEALPGHLAPFVRQAEAIAAKAGHQIRWNLLKFARRKAAISLLWYPGFDEEAHPAQHSSVHVNLETWRVTPRNYVGAKNAPILHRKELFVSPAYHLFGTFVALTESEEKIGLLKECSKVGFRRQWQERCTHWGLYFDGNRMFRT